MHSATRDRVVAAYQSSWQDFYRWEQQDAQRLLDALDPDVDSVASDDDESPPEAEPEPVVDDENESDEEATCPCRRALDGLTLPFDLP